MTTSTPADPVAAAIDAKGGIWGRQLARYPSNGPRALYLGIVVIATIVLYYELYVQGSVATQIAANLHMTLTYLISISIVGNAVGAIASVAAGLADRWGRANLVVYGLALTGALVAFGLPNATTKEAYLILFALVSLVEGVILVATPALIRDFSPQLGRASAMGFWTLGPVIGSLVVSEVSSHTLDAHPDWQFQFRVCGIVGLVVFALAFFGLRELAPRLRDQLMISLRERALIEARARGIEPEQMLKGHWRQMLRADIIGPSFAISIFLLFYYIAVGFFVVFYATTFGYSLSKANGLGNWYWSIQAVALILTGVLSDRLKVRKPFMIFGGLMSAAGVALFAIATGHPDTTYYHWVWIILLISIGSAIAFASWMASFTETVEKHNPAGTATGLAVWGATLRTVVVAALIGLILAIPAAGTLVDKGTQVAAAAAGKDPALSASQNAVVASVAALGANPTDPAAQATALAAISGKSVADVTKVLTLSAQYKDQLATAAAIDPTTQTALFTNPTDQASQATAVGEIAKTLGISAADAVAKLQALATVPVTDLLYLSTNGPPVQAAGAQLTGLSTGKPLPVTADGTGLQDPKVAASLAYLQKEAPGVQKAAKDAPGQWQRWWWICFAGQILFLPFIWMMTGRWSPKKASADAQEHDEAVSRELAALADSEVDAAQSA